MRKLIDVHSGSLEPREVAWAPEPVKAGRTQCFPVWTALLTSINHWWDRDGRPLRSFPPSLHMV